MRRRSTLLAAAAALTLAACGSGGEAAPPAPATVPGVGELPPAPPATSATVDPEAPSSPDETATTTAPRKGRRPTTTTREPEVASVGDLVDGNRLLMIGDSILASTAERYGGEMCKQLVPQGWAVEVDAETGQRIEFAEEVLDARLRAGWDVVAIMLGNNYSNDPARYADQLEEALDEIGDIPVLLYTVTQFRDDRAEVNYIVKSIAQRRDNVRVVDWAVHTEDAPELLGGDGLHLSDTGRRELVALTAYALGRAPSGSRGDCLGTRFTDDSATRPGGR